MEVVKGKNEALLAARGTSCLQEKQNNMSLMAEGGVVRLVVVGKVRRRRTGDHGVVWCVEWRAQ